METRRNPKKPRRPMSAEHKAAISKGQQERYRKADQVLEPVPSLKKCSGPCGKMKRVPEDYTMRKRTLVSGAVKRYPSGECKACAKLRREKWWEGLSEQERKEAYRRWNGARDQAHRKFYAREWSRSARGVEQAGSSGGSARRGPWKRYKHEVEHEVRVPSEPFVSWLLVQRDKWVHRNATDDPVALKNNSNSAHADQDFGTTKDFVVLLGITESRWSTLRQKPTCRLDLVDRIVHVLVGAGVEYDELMDEFAVGAYCKLPRKPKAGRKGWL